MRRWIEFRSPALGGRPHLWSVVAIAVLAWTIAIVGHEGLGHGGACVVQGGRPVSLGAVYFECGQSRFSDVQGRVLAAAGTGINLGLAAIAAAVLPLLPRRASWLRYFVWMSAALNAMQAAGYWLFSGVAGLGDWAYVIAGLGPAARVALALLGTLSYAGVVVLALRGLSVFAGSGPDRLARARWLTIVPYVAGGLLYTLAGALDPRSLLYVLVSAVPAGFGGASGFGWMFNHLRKPERFAFAGSPLEGRAPAWVLMLATVVAVGFVAGLGRTIAF